MSRTKKWLSGVLLLLGSGTFAFVFYQSSMRIVNEPGDLAVILAPFLGYIVAATASIVLGTAMWDRLLVPVAEFSLIGGAFCLGLAFRSIGPNATIAGTVGLTAFAMGYLVLRSAVNRGSRRKALNRIIDNEKLSPGAEALLNFPATQAQEADGTAGSLNAMIKNLGNSVRPQQGRKAALELLRHAS